jgi:(p)ppGpp synthase/HD superfamily hydrolase
MQMRRSKRFEDALRFAAKLHAKQTRKGSDTPYIAHLLAVTAFVLEHGGTEDEAIAALLHDAVEDQGGKRTLRRIRKRYGRRVARIVKGCSDTDTDTDTQEKPPWIERKTAYIDHLRTASPSVRLVAAADKLHNARSVLTDYRALGDELWSRFSVGRDGSLWFYRQVTAALQAAAQPGEDRLNALVAELDEVVTTLERETADSASPQEAAD